VTSESVYREVIESAERVGSRYALVPPRRVTGGLTGGLCSDHPGSSLEFMDHRDYQAGDDLRWVDWSAYARSDRLTVKLYQQEATPHADIILDGSRSMALEGTSKAAAALGLSAIFTHAAMNSGFTHTFWQAGEQCLPAGNARERPRLWTGIAFEGRGGMEESLRAAAPTWRSGGVRILISDLLWLGDPREILAVLSRRAGAVIIIQVLAESDRSGPGMGSMRLIDSENTETLDVYIDAAVQHRYQKRLASHQDQWQRSARSLGAVLATVTAEEIAQTWDLGFLAPQGVIRMC